MYAEVSAVAYKVSSRDLFQCRNCSTPLTQIFQIFLSPSLPRSAVTISLILPSAATTEGYPISNSLQLSTLAREIGIMSTHYVDALPDALPLSKHYHLAAP
jgi:hypothetical protein